MNIEALREYCLKKPGVTESFPFGEDTLVFKVMDKAFALMSLSEANSVNLKCNPERAIELRSEFPEAVQPGYHMNKKHWNTVFFEKLRPKQFLELLDHSYEMVVKGMTGKMKRELEKLNL